jgi:Flp pilus assembly protein TadG
VTNLFAIQRLRQFGRADEGPALILTALVSVALMLVAALDLDVGVLRSVKRQRHKAPDAGAIAVASARICGGQVPVAAQNLDDGSLNGAVLLSRQSTGEKHGANLRNPVAARKGLVGFLGESRRIVSLGEVIMCHRVVPEG